MKNDENDIYAADTIVLHTDEVLGRISSVVGICKHFEQEGRSIDVACGAKDVGLIAGVQGFYDYHQFDINVGFIDLTRPGNSVEPADNVYFFHALEHFKDTRLTLEILRDEFLNTGGRLFIACPNPKHDNNFKPFDSSLGHYAYITPGIIEPLCKHIGLKLLFNAEFNLYDGYEELLMILEKE
jgi:hypothetical protein